MGRTKLNGEQLSNKYQDMKDLLDELKTKRDNSTSDEQKNFYTKKISIVKRNINTFKHHYQDRLFPNIKKEPKEKTPPKLNFSKTTIKQRYQLIEEKAKQLIQQARTEEEKQLITQQLENVRLRFKYSY